MSTTFKLTIRIFLSAAIYYPLVTAVGDGTWNTTVNRVNFEIDLTGTALAGSKTIALHWGMTCGNDTIEGEYSVPEPAILGLLALGLVGIGISKRKNV